MSSEQFQTHSTLSPHFDVRSLLLAIHCVGCDCSRTDSSSVLAETQYHALTHAVGTSRGREFVMQKARGGESHDKKRILQRKDWHPLTCEFFQ